ncbi:MAG: NAD(P)H-dependent oxidoreductase [Patescibacteria group bacterium]
MESKNIFILIGHPDPEPTFTSALANSYGEGAREGGHQVRIQHLGKMQFDPILHRGYKTIQALEPDLIQFQENITWANHVVILYPNWWYSIPALLKGLFDRVWLPGFAFQFFKNGLGWHQKMRGKTARIFICSLAHPLLSYLLFGDFTNELSRGILGFSGFTTKINIFSSSEKASVKTHKRWLHFVRKLGKKGI